MLTFLSMVCYQGAHVTVLSTSPAKKEAAMAMGAHDFVVTSDKEMMAKAKGQLEIILDTVSANHEIMVCTLTLSQRVQPPKSSSRPHLLYFR